METRKAQLSGGSTFTVSLPKEWANTVDLETGDTLYLFPRNRTLILQLDRETSLGQETRVCVDHVSDTNIRRTIKALYSAGFDQITLSVSTELGDQRNVISAETRKHIGLEILESTGSQITLQTLLDSSTTSVKQSTTQLEHVALSMHEDAITTLVEQDEDRVEHIRERDNQADRLFDMIARHFHRSLVTLQEPQELELNRSELYDYQTTARQLERVADHAEKLGMLALQFENSPPSEIATQITTAADESRTIVEQATSTILKETDIKTAYSALEKRDDLIAELEVLERTLHEQDIPESHLIALTIDSLMRTAEYGGNIAETALQAAARTQQL